MVMPNKFDKARQRTDGNNGALDLGEGGKDVGVGEGQWEGKIKALHVLVLAGSLACY